MPPSEAGGSFKAQFQRLPPRKPLMKPWVVAAGGGGVFQAVSVLFSE